jgi:hypothetical protein
MSTEQSVFVIRDFDNSSYKGRHVAVADDELVAQLFVQKYYLREKYNSPVWLDSEWRKDWPDDVVCYRRFTSQSGEEHEIIIEKQTVITLDILSKPFSN